MTELSKHMIGARNGPVSLMNWVKDHKYRNFTNFDDQKQLKYAKQIATVEDSESRKLMLTLLDDLARFQSVCDEMHKEFDTLHAALTKIDANLSPANP